MAQWQRQLDIAKDEFNTISSSDEEGECAQASGLELLIGSEAEGQPQTIEQGELDVVQKSKEIVVPGEADEEEAAANDFGWEIRVCVLAHESASTISMANPPRGSTLPTTSARTRTPGKPVRQ